MSKVDAHVLNGVVAEARLHTSLNVTREQCHTVMQRVEEVLNEELATKANNPNKGKSACRFFRLGTCNRGNDCPFKHQANASQALKGSGKGGAQQICYDFKMGKCTRGNTCKYQHAAQAAVTTPKSANPCFSWQNG